MFITCDTVNNVRKKIRVYKHFKKSLAVPEDVHNYDMDRYIFDEDEDLSENVNVVNEDRGVYLSPTEKLTVSDYTGLYCRVNKLN